jgi:hypothetical protein
MVAFTYKDIYLKIRTCNGLLNGYEKRRKESPTQNSQKLWQILNYLRAPKT